MHFWSDRHDSSNTIHGVIPPCARPATSRTLTDNPPQGPTNSNSAPVASRISVQCFRVFGTPAEMTLKGLFIINISFSLTGSWEGNGPSFQQPTFIFEDTARFCSITLTSSTICNIWFPPYCGTTFFFCVPGPPQSLHSTHGALGDRSIVHTNASQIFLFLSPLFIALPSRKILASNQTPFSISSICFLST